MLFSENPQFFHVMIPNGMRLSFENSLECVISVKSLKLANFLKIHNFSMKDTERYSSFETKQEITGNLFIL